MGLPFSPAEEAGALLSVVRDRRKAGALLLALLCRNGGRIFPQGHHAELVDPGFTDAAHHVHDKAVGHVLVGLEKQLLVLAMIVELQL